jgi:hypothetical protein
MNIGRISAILIYYYLFIYIISYTIIHSTITFFISLFNIYNIHPILSIYLSTLCMLLMVWNIFPVGSDSNKQQTKKKKSEVFFVGIYKIKEKH